MRVMITLPRNRVVILPLVSRMAVDRIQMTEHRTTVHLLVLVKNDGVTETSRIYGGIKKERYSYPLLF